MIMNQKVNIYQDVCDTTAKTPPNVNIAMVI